MRRFLCMVMTGVMMLGFLCTSAGAVEEVNVISGKYETAETAIMRATGTLNCTIKAEHISESSFLVGSRGNCSNSRKLLAGRCQLGFRID